MKQIQKVKDFVQTGLIYCSLMLPGVINAEGSDYVSTVLGDTSNAGDTKTNILNTIKGWVPFAMGIAAAVLLLIAIIRGVNLALSGGSPQQRREAINGILFLVLGAAVVGGATLIVSLSFGLIGNGTPN